MQTQCYWQYLFHQRGRDDNVGGLSKWAFNNLDWDGKKTKLHSLVMDDEGMLAAYFKSEQEFRGQRKRY